MAPGTSDPQSSSSATPQGLREQLSVMYRGVATLPESLPNHDADDDDDENDGKIAGATNEASDAKEANDPKDSSDSNRAKGENEAEAKKADKG